MKLTPEQKFTLQAMKSLLEKHEEKLFSEVRRIVRQEVRDILDGSSASITAPKRPKQAEVYVDEDDYEDDIRPMRENKDYNNKFKQLNKDVISAQGDAYFEDANGRTVDLSNLPMNEGTIKALENIDRDYSDFL